MIEMKIILTKSEFKELLMEAWANGWMDKEERTDNNKRSYADLKIALTMGGAIPKR